MLDAVASSSRPRAAFWPDLARFFILAFVLAWGGWWLTWRSGQEHSLWSLLAGLAPSLAGLICAGLESGRAGLKSLRVRLCPRSLGLGWVAFSLLGPPLLFLLALGLYMLAGGAAPRYLDPAHALTKPAQWPLILPVFAYILLSSALGEELGWRGYALPRLLSRWDGLRSSLLLGAMWTAWHLPLFFLPGNFHARIPLAWFSLQILASTFLYTWMSLRTRGSLLPALLFHAAGNTAVGVLPVLPADLGGSAGPLWIMLALEGLLVLLVVWRDRRMRQTVPTACV